MTIPTLGLDELRRGSRAITERRREARRDYERYAEAAAEAEREYRKTLAKRLAVHRVENNLGVTEAEIMAQGDAADARYRRDIAQSLAKSSLLRIEELERDAATLRSIGEWSQRIEGVAA